MGKARPGAKKGQKYDKWQRRTETVTCPTCNGSGKRGDRTCPLCNGSGTIQALKD